MSVFDFKFPCPVKCEANYFTGDCPVKCEANYFTGDCPVKCEANYFTGDCPVKCGAYFLLSAFTISAFGLSLHRTAFKISGLDFDRFAAEPMV
jgi:hypothetical protein